MNPSWGFTHKATKDFKMYERQVFHPDMSSESMHEEVCSNVQTPEATGTVVLTGSVFDGKY